MKRLLRLFLPLLLTTACSTNNAKVLDKIIDWFILLDYNSKESLVDSKQLKAFQMGILDPVSHPDFTNFNKKFIAIAYLSIGEAADYRDYWEEIKTCSWILSPNPNWPGDYYVDVRSPRWQEIILEKEIPKIIKEGFQGVFLDTLDTASYLESIDENKYRGSIAAMVELIHKIRERYPQIYILSNNGLEFIDKVISDVDALVVESVFSAAQKTESLYKLDILQRIKKQYKKLVFIIDYVDKNTVFDAKKLRKMALRDGFKPYIAEKDLNKIYTELNLN